MNHVLVELDQIFLRVLVPRLWRGVGEAVHRNLCFLGILIFEVLGTKNDLSDQCLGEVGQLIDLFEAFEGLGCLEEVFVRDSGAIGTVKQFDYLWEERLLRDRGLDLIHVGVLDLPRLILSFFGSFKLFFLSLNHLFIFHFGGFLKIGQVIPDLEELATEGLREKRKLLLRQGEEEVDGFVDLSKFLIENSGVILA